MAFTLSRVLALCIVVTLLVADSVCDIGFRTGCSDGQNMCLCGETGRTFPINYERCTYFYRWRPYCKECDDDFDFAAQCAQFIYCQSCDSNGCLTCPTDRYGNWCDMTCNCQNNGMCNSDGSCTCSDQFEGEKCEQRKPVYCPQPDIPANSRLDHLGPFIGGKSVKITCNKNYHLIGSSATLLCDFHANWIGELGKCEPLCEALETPNGSLAIVTSFFPGTSTVRSILYDCLSGYELQGLDKIDCRADGTWSGQPPVCVGRCEEPLAPEHGTVLVQGLLEGSHAVYMCNEGYVLKGAHESKCKADRQWTHTTPICEPVGCGVPDLPDHGYLSATNFTFRGIVTYTCKDTYVFVEPVLEARTCQSTGNWSGSTPRCVKDVSCRDPGHVANAARFPGANVKTFHAGDIITFNCIDNFKMVSGDNMQICLPEGVWSGQQPICVPETACEDPGIPEYSVRQIVIQPPATNIRSFDRVRLGQSSSSSINSESSASVSESLIAQNVEEQEHSEEDVEQETNSLPNGFLITGTQLTFRCKSSLYKLYGSTQMTCINGRWRGQNPTCKPVCGKASGNKQAYVVGGNDTIAGQWPWHAALYKHAGNKRRLICGVSILTDTLVLTAAHCVRERTSHRLQANTSYEVEVGKYYRLSHERDEEWIQSFNVSAIFVHYNYNPFTLEGDIAVLQLDSPMEFTARVRPVCLPSPSVTKRNLKPGNRGVLTGWGRTEKKSLPTILQQADIPVVSRLHCQKMYQKAYPDKHNIIVTRDMFCAGYREGGVDSCVGDSGGPLVFSRGVGEMKSWYIEGIVSWGSPDGRCGVPNEFGVYTKVSKYLPWLNEFVNLG